MPQYFAAFEPFEIFDNFNGVPGTYIKSFLISDKINLNKWQTTHEANISNIDTFLGRPGIHYISPESGKRDHTGATSFEKSLQLQELYRAASIIAVGSDIPTKKNWQVSKMVDPEITEKIKSGEIKFISPSIWPDEGAVEIINQTDGDTIDVVHGYRGLHYAFVDEPAYGIEAEIKSFCDGTTKACQIELQKFDASISEVGPIIDKKIIVPDNEKKKEGKDSKDSSNWPANTSQKVNSSSKQSMATVEDLQKKLDESEKALKATNEELEKLKDTQAKKATDEQEEMEKKNSEAKKATDEEEKEKEALKARIAVLEKEPIVEKIVSAQLSAGIITEDKISEITSSLMAATKDELDRTLMTSKSYEAKLKSLSASVTTNIPYMGSDAGSFDASLNDVDDEQLLMEVGN